LGSAVIRAPEGGVLLGLTCRAVTPL